MAEASPEGPEVALAADARGSNAGEPRDEAENGAAALAAGAQSELGLRLQELVRQAEQQAQQLELEGRTRAELEDVLQRIERHFRSEQAVRRRAEEAERDATSELMHERELRVRLEEELRVRCAETKETDVLRATLEAEHADLDDDCKRVEEELTVARSEAKKALSTLAKTEEAVRQTEAMERLKIEAEHNLRMTRLSAELELVREELDIRTRVIGAEMVRWRAQAEAAAAAVRDAKDELMDRKRELDVTKERMDGLVEKLYVGREKGLELRGAIESHLERFKQHNSSIPVPPPAAIPPAAAAPEPVPQEAAPKPEGDVVSKPVAQEPPKAPVAASPQAAQAAPPTRKPAAPAARGYADMNRAGSTSKASKPKPAA